jgi:WG containing repeat
MPLRLFLSLVALSFAAPALAQQACTPRDTPDIGAAAAPPVLFGHCAEEGKCGAVDKTGAWKVPPKFRDVLIKDDFIVVPENDDWSKYGFLDANGVRLGGGDYTISIEEALPVSEGMLPVIVNEKMGFVDRTGAVVVPAEYDEAYGFLDGLAGVVSGDKRLFIDKTGKEVLAVPEGVDDVQGFVGEFAVIAKEGKFGLIDRKGAIVVEPKFDSLYQDAGVLIALEGDKTGIVDGTGAWIGKPDFAAIGPFSKGIAPAQQGEVWGFIDTCANWKIPAKYEAAIGFDGGPARVKLGEKWGLIDETGAEIFPVSVPYIDEGIWRDGLIGFSPDDLKYGLLNAAGKVAVEPKYDSIEPLGGGVLMSYTGEEEKLLNLDGSEIKIAAP